MNSDVFFKFSPLQKEMLQPANDLAVKPKAPKIQTRRTDDHAQAGKSSSHHTERAKAAADKSRADKAEGESFERYISNAGKGEQKEAAGATASEASMYSQLDDLRALLAQLLADLKGESGNGDSDAAQEGPEDLLLSLFSSARADLNAAGDGNGASEEARGPFFTRNAANLDAGTLPEGLQNLLNAAGGRGGLEALAEFLRGEGMTALDGITPETLTQLQQEVEQAIEEDRSFDSSATLNGILAQVVALARPDAQMQGADTGHQKATRFEERYDLERFGQNTNGAADDTAFDFRSAMRAAQAVHSPEAHAQNAASKADASTPALFFTMTAEGFSGGADLPDAFVPPVPNGAAGVSAPALSGPSLTSPALHASSAAQPHPAVQTVAATIQRSGSEKQDTRITIQLDPPELGRVEVKMSMNKDNAAKVVLTIEKPETFAMLQRDAHVLERALADAGLSPDGSGLEFSLADDGYAFGRDDGEQRSGHGYAGSGEVEQTVITASPTGWRIDPLTGRMQYDALV